MLALWRGSTSNMRLRRSNTSGYPLKMIGEMKMCDASIGYVHFRGGNWTTTGTVPRLDSQYDEDSNVWAGVWPGNYDNPSQWPVSEGLYVTDGMIHNHGSGSNKAQSIAQLSWLERYYTLPSGIVNPPVECRMSLQHCGPASYVTSQIDGSYIWDGVSSYPSGSCGNVQNYPGNASDGLELYFWAVNGTSTLRFLLSEYTLRNMNADAGNSISVTGGWPKWSGLIVTSKLTGLPALFAESPLSKVGCRFRWVWSTEYISPQGCPYCFGAGSTAAYCATPAAKLKHMDYPELAVWG